MREDDLLIKLQYEEFIIDADKPQLMANSSNVWE